MTTLKASHFVTIDRGEGPISFISIMEGEMEEMILIKHKAKFNGVVSVDPVEARASINRLQGAKFSTTRVLPEFQETLSQGLMSFLARRAPQTFVFWNHDGEAVFLETAADVAQFAAEKAKAQPSRPAKARVMI